MHDLSIKCWLDPYCNNTFNRKIMTLSLGLGYYECTIAILPTVSMYNKYSYNSISLSNIEQTRRHFSRTQTTHFPASPGGGRFSVWCSPTEQVWTFPGVVSNEGRRRPGLVSDHIGTLCPRTNRHTWLKTLYSRNSLASGNKNHLL